MTSKAKKSIIALGTESATQFYIFGKDNTPVTFKRKHFKIIN